MLTDYNDKNWEDEFSRSINRYGKRERQAKRKKQRKENRKLIKPGDQVNLDEIWLEAHLIDRTIIYKDGKQYDIDTGKEVFILW